VRLIIANAKSRRQPLAYSHRWFRVGRLNFLRSFGDRRSPCAEAKTGGDGPPGNQSIALSSRFLLAPGAGRRGKNREESVLEFTPIHSRYIRVANVVKNFTQNSSVFYGG